MSDRRTFLKAIGCLAAVPGLALPHSAMSRTRRPRIAFSTLGCPEWTLSQILDTAVREGYEAVELRGIGKEMFLPRHPAFDTPAHIGETRKLFAQQGIKICNLGSSAALHHADPEKRRKNLDEARQFIDLAKALSCPYVRVFPDDLPKDQERAQTIGLISEGLRELGSYAAKSNVTVLLESHGKVVGKDILLEIMQKSEHSHVGLIWDFFNMWSVTGEPPAEVWRTLKKYIRHVHVKDGSMVNGKPAYRLIGQGTAPVAEAITAMKKDRYKGYYSFEWEKRWHPEIAEPEVAFADYPKSIRQYF